MHLDYYADFMSILNPASLGCTLSGSSYTCNCLTDNPGTFPKIQLRVTGTSRYFEIDPFTYLAVASATAGKCKLMIAENTINAWSLGTPFLSNYITIFDDDNTQIGFVPQIYANITINQGALPPVTQKILPKELDPQYPAGSTVDFWTGLGQLGQAVAFISALSAGGAALIAVLIFINYIMELLVLSSGSDFMVESLQKLYL